MDQNWQYRQIEPLHLYLHQQHRATKHPPHSKLGATPTTTPSPIPAAISAAGSVEKLLTGAWPCGKQRTWQRTRPRTGHAKQSEVWAAAAWAAIWTTSILCPAAATIQAAQCADTSQPSQAFQKHELLPQLWVRRGRLAQQQYMPLPKAEPKLECNSR